IIRGVKLSVDRNCIRNLPDSGIKPIAVESYPRQDCLGRASLVSGKDKMTRLRFTALCSAILKFAGCGQVATDPAKTTAERGGAARSQVPASAPLPVERGGDGGGGGGY